MHKFISLLRLVLVLPMSVMSMAAYGIAADPSPIQWKLPDGTTVAVMLRGDEHHHAYQTTDGFAILPASDGFFRYAVLDADKRVVQSDVRVSNVAHRTADERRFLAALPKERILEQLDAERSNVLATEETISAGGQRRLKALESTFPTTGEQRGLVILVDYTDVKFQYDSATVNNNFKRMLNEKGYTENNSFGSARDYFLDQSLGKFSPTFDVVGPVTLEHNMGYYGGNGGNGSDQHPQEMAIEACYLVDDYVDFSLYDRDQNGEIDNVYIFYAGLGEANSDDPNTVWPHSVNLTELGTAAASHRFDGLRLNHYAASNERDPHNDMTGIGTFCHEFSHVLGFPDIYSTTYSNAFTPGAWDLLDRGSYNGDARRPPYYTAYERYEMGWLEPVELTRPASLSLRSVDENQAYIVRTSQSNEYFLLENRQQQGWDTNVPGHGMLIWHIDYQPNIWRSNIVNASPTHQYIDIEEADGTQNDGSRAGDPFPGTAGVTEFTDETTPSMLDWRGVGQNKPITNIRESGGVIYFDVMGGRPPLPVVVAQEATDVQPDAFTARWERAEDVSDYLLSVYTVRETADGRTVVNYLDGYNARSVGDTTAWTLAGLTPETEYRYTVAAAEEDYSGDASAEIIVRTPHATFAYLAPTALEASDVAAGTFTAQWLTMDSATAYEVDVYRKRPGVPDTLRQDFAAGVQMGSLWTTNASGTYGTVGYSGADVPSLRLSSDHDYLETAVLDDDVHSVAFWHRGQTSRSAQNRLVAQIRVGEEWAVLDSITPVSEAGGITLTYDSLPQGVHAFRLVYLPTQNVGVAIDDVVLTYGGVAERLENDETLAGLTDLRADAPATRKDVSGLAAATYYYRVRAWQDAVPSRWSNEVTVVVAESATAIEEVRSQPSAREPWVRDLYGRRLHAVPERGLYVVDGKIYLRR